MKWFRDKFIVHTVYTILTVLENNLWLLDIEENFDTHSNK